MNSSIFLVISSFLGVVNRWFFIFAWYPIDAPPRIAETLILSLNCVDAIPAAGLSLVILAKLALLMGKSKGLVFLGI